MIGISIVDQVLVPTENVIQIRKGKKVQKEKVYFPDHYNYSKSDIDKLIIKAKSKKLKLLTTEKDFFRLKLIGYKNIKYLSVELKIENERLLIEKLKSL